MFIVFSIIVVCVSLFIMLIIAEENISLPKRLELLILILMFSSIIVIESGAEYLLDYDSLQREFKEYKLAQTK